MRRSLIALSLVGTALIGFPENTSVAGAAHPPAPSPCAADGTCRPNTATWGHYNTQWRPWPGDSAALPPTPAGAEQPDAERDEELRGFEPPLPQKENQIGPETRTPEETTPPAGVQPPAAPAGAAPARAVPAGEVPAGATPDVMPALDPLGANRPQALPEAAVVLRNPMADQQVRQAPVALPLPPSFRPQASEVRPSAYETPAADVDAPPALPASLLRVAQLTRTRQISQLQIRTDENVQPTSAEATGGIRIINPAAAMVADPGAQGLQQAIYFEDSQTE
jgi:hypothetical protein